MNRSIFDWAIEITWETEEKEGESPTNLVSEALVKFFKVFGINVNKKEMGIPLFGMEKKGVRLLIIPSHCIDRSKDYFKELIFQSYSTDTIDLTQQRFLLVESGFSNRAWRSERFFHVMGAIFTHLGIGLKLQVDKLLTFFSPGLAKGFLDLGEPGRITNRELRNHIEATCFTTGVEEMREFLLRDTSIFHELIFKKLEIGNNKENQNENDIKIRKSAVRLIYGAWLAGDIDKDIPERVLKEFCGKFLEKNELIEGLNDKIKDLNQIHFRFKNPLWKYLENRKIALIEDRSEIEKEGWDIVLPAIFHSPGQLKPVEVVHFKDVNEALDSFKDNRNGMELTDFDLILLDLYSSVSGHSQSIQVTNMKDPLWQLIERLDDIRKSHIGKSIPQPMPQIIVFTRDDKGITVRTMFKQLNAADYFFKITGAEEHKCGYYSSFRNAVLSALKENVYQVGRMTDIPSRMHFNKWLRQFDPCDRPLILHLMKHFKYFSAANIVKLFDIYLKENTNWEDYAVSILKSSHRKPGRFYISYLGRPNKSAPSTLSLISKTEWLKTLRKESENQGLEDRPKFLSYEDLLQAIVEDILTKDFKVDNLCLLLIDDFIGSGGQLKDYVKKFINTDLKTVCDKLIVNPRIKGSVWEKVKNTFKEEQNPDTKNVEIHVLYALGIKNKYFERMICKKHSNINLPHSRNGIYEFNITEGKKQKITILVNVHVAHYTKSIHDIFGDIEEIENTLKKYSVIMQLRDEDYPCDFEPWGWKENGGLLATYANAQGNSIPVIWRDYKSEEDVVLREHGLSIKEWFPLYPRYFNPLTPAKSREKEKLKCFIKKMCSVNPKKWNKPFFEEYWGNENNSDPPCKIKS